MPSSRPSLIALPPLSAGAAAVLGHGTALLLCLILASLLGFASLVMCWCADKPRRDREQIENQALSRIGQDDPERVVELLARLTPLAHPFEREPPPAEGPSPPG
jgi:hypothetical protein